MSEKNQQQDDMVMVQTINDFIMQCQAVQAQIQALNVLNNTFLKTAQTLLNSTKSLLGQNLELRKRIVTLENELKGKESKGQNKK